MTYKVLLFASLRERIGQDHLSLELTDSEATVAALLRVIEEQHPELREILPHVRVAIDHEFGAPHATLPTDAEIALIPPVSGG